MGGTCVWGGQNQTLLPSWKGLGDPKAGGSRGWGTPRLGDPETGGLRGWGDPRLGDPEVGETPRLGDPEAGRPGTAILCLCAPFAGRCSVPTSSLGTPTESPRLAAGPSPINSIIFCCRGEGGWGVAVGVARLRGAGCAQRALGGGRQGGPHAPVARALQTRRLPSRDPGQRPCVCVPGVGGLRCVRRGHWVSTSLPAGATPAPHCSVPAPGLHTAGAGKLTTGEGLLVHQGGPPPSTRPHGGSPFLGLKWGQRQRPDPGGRPGTSSETPAGWASLPLPPPTLRPGRPARGPRSWAWAPTPFVTPLLGAHSGPSQCRHVPEPTLCCGHNSGPSAKGAEQLWQNRAPGRVGAPSPLLSEFGGLRASHVSRWHLPRGRGPVTGTPEPWTRRAFGL